MNTRASDNTVLDEGSMIIVWFYINLLHYSDKVESNYYFFKEKMMMNE